jgi:cytidine deaminase
MTTLPGLVFTEHDELVDRGAVGEQTRHVLQVINAYRTTLLRPYQSHFRVIALVVYKDGEGKFSHICGANAEPCTIGGSICAERAALVSLRHVPPPVKLLALYVVTDEARDALFPGILCKEYLSSMADDDLPIFVANTETTDVQFKRLGELYPFASLYRYTDRNDLVATGQALAKKMKAPAPGSHAATLYEEVLQATARDDKDDFHPIRYAAGVLFDDKDGTRVVAWQKKGIEYGTTIDAMVLLAHVLESHKAQGLAAPTLLLQCDQFGIMHPPSGHARGFLMEYGYEDVPLLVHDTHTGELLSITVGATAPGRPLISFGRDGDGKTKKEGGRAESKST